MSSRFTPYRASISVGLVACGLLAIYVIAAMLPNIADSRPIAMRMAADAKYQPHPQVTAVQTRQAKNHAMIQGAATDPVACPRC